MDQTSIEMRRFVLKATGTVGFPSMHQTVMSFKNVMNFAVYARFSFERKVIL